MMPAVAFVAGFLAMLVARTFAGSLSFEAVAAVLAYALYLLFYSGRPAMPFLVGTCLAQESFGTSHFGLASALGLTLVMLYRILGARLNFTSLYIRYLLALLISFVAYCLILSQPSGAAAARLAVTYVAVSAIAYYATSLTKQPSYELV